MEAEKIKIPIHDYLPHRKPMLMVDYILDINQEYVLCEFKITDECIFVSDQMLCEAGIIEHMAQTCSSIVGQNYYQKDYNPEQDKRILGFISGIKRILVHKLPKVGDVMFSAAQLLSKFDGGDYTICTLKVEARVDEVLIAESELNLYIQGVTNEEV